MSDIVHLVTVAEKSKNALIAKDVVDFLDESIPEREFLLEPIIRQQSKIMVHGWRGIGKTFFGLGIAIAVATGGSFLGWRAPKPRKVLHVDGEMSAKEMQDRIRELLKPSSQSLPKGNFRIITPDFQASSMPDLATPQGQELIDSAVEPDTDLIIIDNLSSLARHGGAENEAESWTTLSEWALRHRQLGRAILFMHHTGKNGGQRGTSKREDLLDVVIKLDRLMDADPTAGAAFQVRFEKTRSLYGSEAEPIDVQLVRDQNGYLQWASSSTASIDERIAELKSIGMSQRKIAEELHVSASTVCRSLKRPR